jgi:hypothetical protein
MPMLPRVSRTDDSSPWLLLRQLLLLLGQLLLLLRQLLLLLPDSWANWSRPRWRVTVDTSTSSRFCIT